MIKIVIADDDDIFRDGLKLIIEQDKGIQVCGVASDGNMAYSLCESKKPDLVLMDMQMPCCDGGNATLKIKRDFPEIKVLVLTTFDDRATVNKALSTGADVKRKFANGSINEQINLSKREKELLVNVAEGLSNREISEKMFLSEGTVRNNISALLFKLKLRDRTQLAVYAVKNDYI